ncbi:hypothetical protein EDEG_04202 [Edhazardia aedis USNM 41457]|uniref:Uncharacterized protein n=1 Tax=Edhazardia aedis (strain USNM 41457) TaxID=1003232 RepID=J9DB14_EDHAE|nr:hypothetical protein EDEG_04202 [Edhazardia aedis USNM 41457]|eukprot:EJW04684.1 hypothetical protein EDEG_04202 [Edhazardia aedis USNM 41457]
MLLVSQTPSMVLNVAVSINLMMKICRVFVKTLSTFSFYRCSTVNVSYYLNFNVKDLVDKIGFVVFLCSGENRRISVVLQQYIGIKFVTFLVVSCKVLHSRSIILLYLIRSFHLLVSPVTLHLLQ